MILTITINIFSSYCTVFHLPPYVVEFILHVLHIPGVLSVSLIWLYRESFQQPPTVRHTFFPQYLAIINNIVMNIYPKKTCFRPFLIISLRYITRRRVLNQRDMHFLKIGREGCQVAFSPALSPPVISCLYLPGTAWPSTSFPCWVPGKFCPSGGSVVVFTQTGNSRANHCRSDCPTGLSGAVDKASPGHWQAHLLFIS